MIFFDAKDIITQRERTGELRELQESKAYYTNEIATEKKSTGRAQIQSCSHRKICKRAIPYEKRE